MADNLHYGYVGLAVNGQLFGSDKLPEITEVELREIAKLKNVGKNIWQKPTNVVLKQTFEQLNISAVAELRDANGEEFGQILIGGPCGYNSYRREDLLQIEMIINLVASIIDSAGQNRWQDKIE